MPGSLNHRDVIRPEASFTMPQSENRGPPKRWVKRYRTEIAACSASIISTTLSFPLDSVKTRMQTYNYQKFMECVRDTYRKERVRGFFRGVAAPVASITLVRTISMSAYQKSKYTYAAWIKRSFGIDPLVHANTMGKYPNAATVTCFGAAGATAGALITFVACPFELTKLSAQISVLMADRTPRTSLSEPNKNHAIARSYQNKGTWKTAKNIIKYRGLSGLYSGLSLHLLRDTLGTGIYFATYETSKQILGTYRGDSAPASPLAVVTAGGLCGALSWILIYPIDSAKSIYQRNCLTHEVGQTKPAPQIQFFNRRMYRGVGVSVTRSCVVNAIFFSAFEFFKKQINSLQDF